MVQERYSPDAAMGELKQSEQVETATIRTITVCNYIEMGCSRGLRTRACRSSGARIGADIGVEQYERTEHRGESKQHRYAGRRALGDGLRGGKTGTKACLLVLTERKHATELIFKMKDKTQNSVQTVQDGLECKYGRRFSTIFRSIAEDNGCEFPDGELS